MAIHVKGNLSFDKWYRMLQRIAKAHYGFELTGMASSWQDFYDDGFTPREALDEDTYAGI